MTISLINEIYHKLKTLLIELIKILKSNELM